MAQAKNTASATRPLRRTWWWGPARKCWAITIGANTRIGAGSVVVRDVDDDCTVVGIPGRVIHQSGVRINPLAHSALPDAEANVIRNLMERIDELEDTVANLQRCLREVAEGRQLRDVCRGESRTQGPGDSGVPRRRCQSLSQMANAWSTACIALLQSKAML